MSETIDVKEISKFNAISSKYWEPEGPMRALHQINPLRIDFVESFFPLQDALVLDVGCGGGLASEALALRGARVTAIDASQDMIDVAKLHSKEANLSIEYKISHANDFASGNGEMFDVITCFEMLEHVPNPRDTLAVLCTMIRPGGILVCSTINRTVTAYLGAIVAAEHILNWVAKGTHDYSRFLKPSEICAAIRPHQMIVESIEGVVYQPLYQQFKRVTNNLSINYQLVARKINDA